MGIFDQLPINLYLLTMISFIKFYENTWKMKPHAIVMFFIAFTRDIIIHIKISEEKVSITEISTIFKCIFTKHVCLIVCIY